MSSERSKTRTVLLGWLAAVVLAACGSEHAPDPLTAVGRESTAETDLAFKDPTDSLVTSIDLSTSLAYESDTNGVRIFALVRDQEGELVPGLNRHNFTVVLNPKTADRAVPPGDTALDMTASEERVVALVMDSSGSMTATTDTGLTRMQVAKEAGSLFVSLMSPGDRTSVVDFDDSARVVQQLTDDQDALQTAIAGFTAEGATNIGGALTEAVRAVGTRPGKRAAILLTDGDDTVDSVQGGPDVWLTDPSSTRFQGLKLSKESKLVVYTVGLGTDLSEQGLADLRTIASETGGTFFAAPTAADLLTAFGETIPGELDALPPMETYLLTFTNPVPRLPGKLIDVPVFISVEYENASGVHRSQFDATYTIQ
jgi:Mg-chelatase subunit ChlD